MHAMLTSAALTLTVAAIPMAGPAQARGCLKGVAMGGVAGISSAVIRFPAPASAA